VNADGNSGGVTSTAADVGSTVVDASGDAV
jgi:hypothetical protein